MGWITKGVLMRLIPRELRFYARALLHIWTSR